MKLSRIRIVAGLAVIGLSVLTGTYACRAASTVIVGAKIPESRRIPVDRIDHSAWDGLVQKYVDSAGLVDYRGCKASARDREVLGNYLHHLSAASFGKDASREAKLAFWINAYNAVTVEGILREYPTTSIRNHTAKVLGYNIWKDLQLLVGDESYSLDQMEHEILRKMDEPRIHFAIVCASIGCPRLLNEAYTADELDAQLTANAKAFFADDGKFRYDSARKAIAVSPILDWFGEDFGKTQAERLRKIAPYLPDTAAQEFARSGTARVTFLEYDWGLNDQAKRGSRR